MLQLELIQIVETGKVSKSFVDALKVSFSNEASERVYLILGHLVDLQF